MRIVALLVCLVVAMAASAATPTSPLGKWRIVAVSGAEGLDPARTLAELANGRFASTIGCNRISGAATFARGRLSFGPMAATRMACPPPLDRVEAQYLANLQAVRSFAIKGDALSFVGETGAELVRLERAP
jgi:heat shock protein HslJ